MSYDTPHRLKSGGDPRTLPDYAALRDELNKLTHPARPDVNWSYAEKLCLSLFEHNGIELQTAAWYTLVRTQLAGLYGLNEGLAILEALITRQWGSLWPQPVHARMDILSGLSKRLQQTMRTVTLTYADLSLLYQAERHLTGLCDTLERLELKHLSQFEALRMLMHTASVRLENRDSTAGHGNEPLGDSATPSATASLHHTASPESGVSLHLKEKSRWIYVAQPVQPPNIAVVAEPTPPPRLWKAFTAGVVSMLVVGTVAVWGWLHAHRPDPLLTQLNASLAPLPVPLNSAQRQALRGALPPAETVIRATQQQLTRLAALPPGWNITRGSQLVRQAAILWPEQSAPLRQQWQQQLEAMALPAESLNGWHQGMAQLQQLTDRLNGLDEEHGKYMTVSELKSQVFGITQAFNRAVPVEEQLRQLALKLQAAQQNEAEMSLNALLNRYVLIITHQPEHSVMH